MLNFIALKMISHFGVTNIIFADYMYLNLSIHLSHTIDLSIYLVYPPLEGELNQLSMKSK